MSLPRCDDPFIHRWTLRLLPLLYSFEKCCYEHAMQISLPGPVVNFFKSISRNWIADGSYDFLF